MESHAVHLNKALIHEIIEMKDIDQKARYRVIEFYEKEGLKKNVPDEIEQEVRQIDALNNAKLKEIIRVYGWPGYSLVGKEGSDAFWLCLQHQDQDVNFQKTCLILLEKAYQKGDASPQNVAYLTDRIRKNEGLPQVYGTQWVSSEQKKFKLYPVEDPDKMEERRKAMGLPSFKESKQSMMELLKIDHNAFE